MPIFEYKCNKCNCAFEKLVFAGDKQKFSCPECGEKDVKKLMSSTSYIGNSGMGTCTSDTLKGHS